jgi:hypothetical protein
MSASKYKRPATAKPKKSKQKTKKKKERMTAQEQYMNQLRQQQLLQQLAMEQQNRQQMEQDENQIEITPEQAAMMLQQLIEKQQNGEELSEEEIEQFQFLQQVLQNNFVNQQELQEEQQLYPRPLRQAKTTKRKKSKKKAKKKKTTKQRQVYENALMMMQNQQIPQQYAQDHDRYDVDEIKEVDEEETPIRGLSGEGEQIYRGEGEGEIETTGQDPANAGVHDTDIPNQINAQVPAKFRVQYQPEDDDEEEEEQQYVQSQPNFYPQYQLNPVEQENFPPVQAVTPEQLYYLKEMNKNQMIASKLENYSDLYNPLSQAVNKAKAKLKGMRNYDLDVVDKKLHEEIIAKRQGIQSFGVSFIFCAYLTTS